MFPLFPSVNQAYRAAMQTQWSWILQLCHCVEQHLKENAVYFDVSYTASFSVTDFHDLSEFVSDQQV